MRQALGGSERERDSVMLSMMRAHRFSSQTISPECPRLSVHTGSSGGWRYSTWLVLLSILGGQHAVNGTDISSGPGAGCIYGGGLGKMEIVSSCYTYSISSPIAGGSYARQLTSHCVFNNFKSYYSTSKLTRTLYFFNHSWNI